MKNYTFSNHDTVELAKKYGTPLYVMSEDIIEENINKFKNAFERCQADYDINFAGKAFLNLAMCKIAKRLGISLDVVSGGELYTADKAGFPMDRICFHGNNKSVAEIKMAFEKKVGKIIVDSEYELELINQLAEQEKVKPTIMIRVSPGVEADTNAKIRTGSVDSKFGVPLVYMQDILSSPDKYANVNLIGLHCHIGSQIFDEEPFVRAAKTMLQLMKSLEDKGFHMTHLNLGGGFGATMTEKDRIFNIDKYIEKLLKATTEECKSLKMKMPKLLIEPGRYVVANAGITLYEVGVVKEIPDVRTYVSVDGSMNDNPRPILYGAEYEAIIANKVDAKEKQIVRVSGRCCETDTLIPEIELAKCQPGDIMAVFNTGADNYSMASNYNRLPKPPVVLLKGEEDEVIVERETYEDLIARDRVPKWYK
ncbi:MAG TPA: diaminopimelate decarboxylase [Eubacteriaceae bacterium]|nr:diaminopimelate decarboxylase [Eubacteriaceae bacterium]